MNFGAGLPNVLAGVCALSLACGMPPAGIALPNDAVPSPQSGWTMEQLISRLKAQRKPTVEFEEKSYSSLLTEPLSAKGSCGLLRRGGWKRRFGSRIGNGI